MKKLFLPFVTAILLGTAANAEDSVVKELNMDVIKNINFDHYYLGAALASEVVTDFDSGIALVVNGGVPVLAQDKESLALEAELTQTVSSASQTTWGTTLDADITTLAVYGVYKYDIDSSFYTKGRLGFLYESVSISGGFGGDSTDSGLALGVHAGYKVDKQLSIDLGYDYIEADVAHITLGAIYNF